MSKLTTLLNILDKQFEEYYKESLIVYRKYTKINKVDLSTDTVGNYMASNLTYQIIKSLKEVVNEKT